MGSSIVQCDRKMEGWLYLIRQNSLGVQCSRMQYFVLEDNVLNGYTSVPTSKREDPIQSALLDSCICVTDNGREKIDKNVLFMFTLYNPSNHIEQLKLGARSSEEAARWTRALLKAAMKECLIKEENVVSVSKRRWESFRLSRNRCRMTKSVDWTTFSNIHSDLMTSDVIAPSPWTIFGCNNGLRLFKEAKDADFYEKYWGDHPAIMAVGVVEASSEAIFQTVLSLGPSRSEWDFCFLEGSIVEHLDGNNDIIHKQLKKDWLPWGMKKRDLLLRRYWRREDDGTYVILYHSVLHQKCRPQSGYIRAFLKSGGYVISPLNQGKLSVVKHILAVDWKFWKSSLFTSSAEGITIRMLGRIAALRELFRAKLGNRQCTDFALAELRRIMSAPHTEQEEIKVEIQCGAGNSNNTGIRGETIQSSFRQSSKSGSFIQLNDAADEFYDILDEPEHEQPEAIWSSEEQRQYKLSTASGFVKRLHKRAVQKKDYIDLQETLIGDTMPCSYGNTLRKDTTFNVPCSWAEADPSTFLIRSESYLCGQNKVKANGTLMQMVAADWLKSDKPEHDLGSRPGGIVQKYANRGGNEFFFIVNFQVPGSTTYSLAFYYKIDKPIESVPLLERFVKGDDAYRNSRFKVIPYISKGSWIVKQSVGKKACLVGQALDLVYFCGKNYLEVVVDIGSSTIARGIASLVLGYLTNLVIEMAFLTQGNAEEELPEFLLGTCRLNHLDASKAVPITSWKH